MELSVSSVQSENNRRFLNFETGQDLQNYLFQVRATFTEETWD
jgi:hypothetical protein